MTDRTRRMFGYGMIITGLAVLILDALDYIMDWRRIGAPFTIIGIMLLVVGMGVARRGKR